MFSLKQIRAWLLVKQMKLNYTAVNDNPKEFGSVLSKLHLTWNNNHKVANREITKKIFSVKISV